MHSRNLPGTTLGNHSSPGEESKENTVGQFLFTTHPTHLLPRRCLSLHDQHQEIRGKQTRSFRTQDTSMGEFWELWCSFGMGYPENQSGLSSLLPSQCTDIAKVTRFYVFVSSFQSWEMEMWRGISLASSFCVVCEKGGFCVFAGFVLQRSTAHYSGGNPQCL